MAVKVNSQCKCGRHLTYSTGIAHSLLHTELSYEVNTDLITLLILNINRNNKKILRHRKENITKLVSKFKKKKKTLG